MQSSVTLSTFKLLCNNYTSHHQNFYIMTNGDSSRRDCSTHGGN